VRSSRGAFDISAERAPAFASELGRWGFCACRQPRQLVLERPRRKALLAYPEVDLPYGLQLVELGKDERDRLLHPTVGVLRDAIVRRLEVAGRASSGSSLA
jgi:hypothetical protein